MEFDVLIVGAGPAGLCLARMLSGHGLRIGVVEQQAQEALATPAFDGREIALTQRSAHMLRQLGLWSRIEAYEPTAFAPLKNAKVFKYRCNRATFTKGKSSLPSHSQPDERGGA